jgi:outer membrane lipoprotein-sorting protein
MKKILLLLISILILLIVTGCSDNKNDVVENEIDGYNGVSAEILEITYEVKGMVVKGLGNSNILDLDEKCYVNCESAYFVYVNNETLEVTEINFDDFIVGDEITFDIELIENKYTVAFRIQLSTQRK